MQKHDQRNDLSELCRNLCEKINNAICETLHQIMLTEVSYGLAIPADKASCEKSSVLQAATVTQLGERNLHLLPVVISSCR